MIRGGGVLIPDAVSMQEVDTENDAADPQYTQVFKVADTASVADRTVTFADAVNAINQDTSGNYLIELADDITLPDTHFVIKANTTILGENHTIHFGPHKRKCMTVINPRQRTQNKIDQGNKQNYTQKNSLLPKLSFYTKYYS